MTSANDDATGRSWNRRNFLTTTMVSTMSVGLLDHSSAKAATQPAVAKRTLLE